MRQDLIDKVTLLKDSELKQLLLSINSKDSSNKLLNNLVKIRTIVYHLTKIDKIEFGDRLYGFRVSRIKNEVIKEVVKRFLYEK